jgi:predicted membrane-bound dolichyl-phosphate-mannose-protein mannosyltransferase
MPAEGSAHVDRVDGTGEAARRRRRWNWLLLVPLALLVYPGLYARTTPVLLGFPFFYWYQFAVVVLTALLTGLVYWATRAPNENDSA